MDLSAIKAVERTFDILHPATELPTGLKMTMVAQSDPRVEKVRRKLTNERLGKRNATKLTAEQLESSGAELLAASIVALVWDGDASFKGEKLKCTPENVALLLKEDWIKKQADDVFSDFEGFFTA